MATRTISAAGGVFTATGTWTGGVAPVANDDIIGDAASGNLTISASTVNLAQVNFSNYLGTITLNEKLNITGAGFTSSFSPTMSFTTGTFFSDSRGILFGNTTNHFIRTNGKKLPWVASLKGGGACSLTLLDDLNCENLSIGYGNQATTILGTFSINVNHFNRAASGGGSQGTLTSTTSTLNFVGPTASYSCAVGQINPPCIANINVDIKVGSGGTFSTFSPLALSGLTTTTLKYTWTSGILAGTKELLLFDINSGAHICRLDFVNAGNWSNIYYNDINSSATDRNLNLISNLLFDNFEASPTGNDSRISPLTRRALYLTGTGALNGGRLKAVPYVMANSTTIAPQNVFGSPTYSMPMLKLTPGAGLTHSFSEIEFMGNDVGIQFRNTNNQVSNNALIQSATASVKATIKFNGGSNLPSYFVQYTDIDASSGNTIYNFGGSQSNSLNIGTVSFGGGTTATSAFTFVN